jgi:flagellar M-ring protein FliF
VAVFVDGTYTESPEGEGLVYTPRGDEQLDQIERVVRTAVGMDVNRGDRIEVVNMQFSERGVEQPLPGGTPGWLELVTQYGGRLVLFAIAIVLALGLKRNLSRLVAERHPAAGGSGRKVAAGADTGSVLEMGGESSEVRMAEEVKEFAAENPEKVAEVLKTWISDSD